MDKLNYCCMKQFTSLEKGGYMYILMGDIKKKRKLYSMHLDMVKPGTIENIVIKMQHNCKSSSTVYSNSNFIELAHEYVLILRKDFPLIYDLKLTRDIKNDIRDLKGASWKDVVAEVMEYSGRAMSLDEIYRSIEGHKKTENNQHWREKVRQTLQLHNIFSRVNKGIWVLA